MKHQVKVEMMRRAYRVAIFSKEYAGAVAADKDLHRRTKAAHDFMSGLEEYKYIPGRCIIGIQFVTSLYKSAIDKETIQLADCIRAEYLIGVKTDSRMGRRLAKEALDALGRVERGDV